MTAVTIHFIGLLLFTGQMTGHPAHYEVTAIAPTVPECIESHTTMIIFKSPSPVTITGWSSSTLTSGWTCVKLSGAAMVEISADGTNPDVTNLSVVKHPKVGGALQTPYKGPAYSGAEAVFTMKKGTLRTCSTGTRIDTALTLNVNTKLTLSSGTNSIELPADASVAILNLPFALADNPGTYVSTGTVEHSMAYCTMTGQKWPCAITPPTGVTVCAGSVIIPAALLATDFACSNTQWP